MCIDVTPSHGTQSGGGSAGPPCAILEASCHFASTSCNQSSSGPMGCLGDLDQPLRRRAQLDTAAEANAAIPSVGGPQMRLCIDASEKSAGTLAAAVCRPCGKMSRRSREHLDLALTDWHQPERHDGRVQAFDRSAVHLAHVRRRGAWAENGAAEHANDPFVALIVVQIGRGEELSWRGWIRHDAALISAAG